MRTKHQKLKKMNNLWNVFIFSGRIQCTRYLTRDEMFCKDFLLVQHCIHLNAVQDNRNIRGCFGLVEIGNFNIHFTCAETEL